MNDFNRDQIELVKRTVCKDATDDELQLFLNVCKRTGLDPFSRQIYAIKRWDSATKSNRVVFQTSIDGYRLTADRSQRYVPGPRPTYTYDANGKLVSAVASVKKQTSDGTWHTFEAEAFFAEYVGTNRDGVPTAMWLTKPHVMISKCAEALALRKGFPAELSGVYTHEEMDAASNELPAHDVKALATDSRKALTDAGVEAKHDAAVVDASPALAPPPSAPSVADDARTIEACATQEILRTTASAISARYVRGSPEHAFLADVVRRCNEALLAQKRDDITSDVAAAPTLPPDSPPPASVAP